MKTLLLFLLTLLLMASCTNREKQVDKNKLLGKDYRLFQATPAWDLAKAVQDEDEEKINEIVRKAPQLINYQEPRFGQTLLMLTIENQQIKPFKTLLANKADVNIHDVYDGTSALIEACSFKHYDTKYAELLLQQGANVNDVEVGKRRQGNVTRYTPLMAAAETGKLTLVELLVKRGAVINFVNEFNQTPLKAAVLQENYEVALFLLERGADYNQLIVDRGLFTEGGKKVYLVDILREDIFPLGSKAHADKMKIVAFLRQKGIDYKEVPVPDFVLKKIKETYPNNWEEYLEKY